MRQADVVSAWEAHKLRGLSMKQSAAVQGIGYGALRSHVSRAKLLGEYVPAADVDALSDDELLVEWSHIRWGSGTVADMAARLGVSPWRLLDVLSVAREKGDERGRIPARMMAA